MRIFNAKSRMQNSKSSSTSANTQRGFTLVELLVVMAIMSILAAMLLPVLMQARESARGTFCASNEKQLFMAWDSYCDNWNQFLPPICSGAPNWLKWQYFMYEELKPAITFRSYYFVTMGGYLDCPVSKDYPGGFSINYCNYGMNSWGIGGENNFTGGLPSYKKVSQIRYPSRQIAFCEPADKDNYGYFWMHPQYGNVRFPHLSRTNALYCDGHVKAEDGLIIEGANYSNRFTDAPWGSP